MKNKWIKTDDNVVVIAGNDKGKMGRVLAKKKDKILVQTVNMRKKHMKRRSENQTAEIIDIEMPIHVSNVALCDKDGNPIKLKKREKDGAIELYYTVDGKETVHRTLTGAKK